VKAGHHGGRAFRGNLRAFANPAAAMPALTPAQFISEDLPALDDPQQTDRTLWISQAGGLTQFGAFVEELAPGSRSSIQHWHSDEDEMVYVLEGEVTLLEGDQATCLRPGDAATFRAGVAVGHCLENRSAARTRCLVVGTRAGVDRVTYPQNDRVLLRNRRETQATWTTLAGAPADSPY
jgi:uncharacterized cupin superfamily protein